MTAPDQPPMTPPFDYWTEVVSCAFDDAGIQATPKQIEDVAHDMRTAHEMEYEYRAPAPNPLMAEIQGLKDRAKRREEELQRQLDETEKLALRARGFSDDSERVQVTYRAGEGAHFEERR